MTACWSAFTAEHAVGGPDPLELELVEWDEPVGPVPGEVVVEDEAPEVSVVPDDPAGGGSLAVDPADRTSFRRAVRLIRGQLVLGRTLVEGGEDLARLISANSQKLAVDRVRPAGRDSPTGDQACAF